MSSDKSRATKCYTLDKVLPHVVSSAPTDARNLRQHSDLLPKIVPNLNQWEISLFNVSFGRHRWTFKLTCVMPRYIQLIKHTIRLPPPVVFRLCKLRFAIMAVQIGMQSIVALTNNRSEINRKRIICWDQRKPQLKSAHWSRLISRGQSPGSSPGNSCSCVWIECG